MEIVVIIAAVSFLVWYSINCRKPDGKTMGE